MMNETRVCYNEICDKTIDSKIQSKPNKSKTPKHKEKHGTVVRENTIFSPDIDEGIYILKDTIKDCRRKCFNSFEYRCVYDINFTNITENDEALLTITLRYMEFKSQFYGLTKKTKSTRNNGFIYKEIIT